MSESHTRHPIPEWDRTIGRTKFEKRNKNPMYDEPTGESKLGEYGAYKDRRVIGRDEIINGGVYLGSGNREEIVVDDTKSDVKKDYVDLEVKKAYEGLYEQLWEKVRSRQKEQKELGQHNDVKNGILSDVFELVMEEMKYDGDFAEKAAIKFKDQKINLSYFINAKKGVCRHQALLVGYLLQRLTAEGYIDGKASIDRNYVSGVGAHAWVRYESGTSGKIYILDPAQKFIGRLEDAPGNWPYKRPEEM
ncbi:MAG: transglutaminase domain-containing protein [Candidatus Saccharibacteria bacterium]